MRLVGVTWRRASKWSAFALATVGLLVVSTQVSALTASNDARTNDGTVRIITRVTYNFGHCSDGQDTYDITGVTTQFTRTSGSGRKVPTSHLLAVGYSADCGGAPRTRSATGSWSPVFGCGGRCAGTTTEAIGISVNFPPLRDQVTCPAILPICAIGGSGDGHAKTSSGTALAPNPICAKVNPTAAQSTPPCPDNFSP
jgi:hypothetical protein